MTLESGKGSAGTEHKAKGKALKTSLFNAFPDGIYYKYGQKDQKFWPYPIFIKEKVNIPSLSPDPLLLEFKRRGNKYYFMMYHPKRGLIGRTEVPGVHRTYILRELISGAGNVKRGGEVSELFVGTLLSINRNELISRLDWLERSGLIENLEAKGK